MSERTGGDPAEHRVGAVLDPKHAEPLVGERGSQSTGRRLSGPARYTRLMVAGASVPCASHRGDSSDQLKGGLNRVRTIVMSNRWLLLILIGMTFVVVLLALLGHADLLQGAFNSTPKKPSGSSATDTTNLYNEIGSLSTDATYILLPSVSLAGAVGGIVWAFGGHRGPSIVTGAVIAGVVGASLDVIVK
jgi:hypothetical protein